MIIGIMLRMVIPPKMRYGYVGPRDSAVTPPMMGPMVQPMPKTPSTIPMVIATFAEDAIFEAIESDKGLSMPMPKPRRAMKIRKGINPYRYAIAMSERA